MATLRLVIASLLVTALLTVPARGQAPTTLEWFMPVDGRITRGETQDWTFMAFEGAVASFHVEAASGNLDPVLTIHNSDGVELIANDDFDYPARTDSLLEAITLPRTDTYTVTVSGFGDSSGDYRLTLLAGFAAMAASENFNDSPPWEAASQPLQVEVADGQIALVLSGTEQRGIAWNSAAAPLADYYAQVRIPEASGVGGWIVGMTAYHEDDEQYYLFTISDQGMWRFLLHTPDGDTVLRDWTPHPAIRAGDSTFTLAMMVNNGGFDFFYNSQLLGRIADAAIDDPGEIGLAVATTGAFDARTTAQFDDLIITVPLVEDGEGVLPQRLLLTDATTMVQEMERRRLIPAGGAMAMTVPESFVELLRPGVNPFLLGGGVTYRNFALATTVSWQTSASGAAGCGLVLRAADDTHYTLAYLDQTGGYGVSQRDGDTFEPGLFGEDPALADSSSHHLLVIAVGDTLYYYLDGRLVGTLESPASEGQVGNAVVNFEPISTSCRFNDTWVWALE